MPLHPSLVLLPLLFSLATAALDVLRLRRPSPDLRRAALLTHLALLAGAIAAAATGNVESARIPLDEAAKAAMERHEDVATFMCFLAGGALLFRVATWRRPFGGSDALLTLLAVATALGFLVAAHLGGTLLFEHGAGVRVR